MFFAPVAALLVLAASTGSEEPRTRRVGQVLAQTGLAAPGISELPVRRSLRRPGKSHVFWTVTSETQDERLRLEITTGLDRGAAARMVEQRAKIIRSIFKPFRDDYLGALSSRVEVPPELRSTELRPRRADDGADYPFFILWSSEGFDYAVRSRQAAGLRGTLGFIYCPERRVLYQIERARPTSAFDQERALAEFRDIRCLLVDGSPE